MRPWRFLLTQDNDTEVWVRNFSLGGKTGSDLDQLNYFIFYIYMRCNGQATILLFRLKFIGWDVMFLCQNSSAKLRERNSANCDRPKIWSCDISSKGTRRHPFSSLLRCWIPTIGNLLPRLKEASHRTSSTVLASSPCSSSCSVNQLAQFIINASINSSLFSPLSLNAKPGTYRLVFCPAY